MSSTQPVVALVGRTNVGKSTLFNRLSEHVKSLTFDAPGVTRDIIRDVIGWQGHSFELIDTGGIELRRSSDPIAAQAQAYAINAIEQADLILFVVDGTIGLLPQDREIAQFLHRLQKPVAVIINKIDRKQAAENLYEFNNLGFSVLLPVSAQHGKGIDDLLSWVVENVPVKKDEPVTQDYAFKIAVLGKPNVGKSSLVNALIQKERFIVADQPGTTREAIGERVRFYQEDIMVTDTPGVRRKRAVDEPLEGLMVQSSLRAVDEADIILLVIDASQGVIVDQELKLAFYVFNQKHKALCILFNKQDIASDVMRADLARSLEPYDYLINKIVTFDISTKTGKNIGKIMPAVHQLWQRHSQQFSDDELTMTLKSAITRTPLFKSRQQLMVKNAHQIKTAPITLMVRVNDERMFGDSERAFLERVMRDAFDLRGVPLVFIFKSAHS